MSTTSNTERGDTRTADNEQPATRATSHPNTPERGIAVGTTTETVTTVVEELETESQPSAEYAPRTEARRNLGIFGAGGHAKVIADIAKAGREFHVAAFFDDDPERHGDHFYGARIVGGQEALFGALGAGEIDAAMVAVGHNEFRRTLSNALRERGYSVATLIHPATTLSPSARIGDGTVVMAGVVVNADTRIGEDVILNTRCSVDHDCFIAPGTHVAPGAAICGGVRVGALALIGVGACVRPNAQIGQRAVIGAGSAVVSDIPDGVTAVGVPARPILNTTSE